MVEDIFEIFICLMCIFVGMLIEEQFGLIKKYFDTVK